MSNQVNARFLPATTAQQLPNVTQSAPDSEWTPIFWGAHTSDDFGVRSAADDAVALTLHSSMDTLQLPQATINVEGDTAALRNPSNISWEWVQVQGDDSGAQDRRQTVRYTGISRGTGPGGSDQLTGCTLGSVTLATGGTVSYLPTLTLGRDTQRRGDFTEFQISAQVLVKPDAGGSVRAVRLNHLVDVFGVGLWTEFDRAGFEGSAAATSPGLGQRLAFASQLNIDPAANVVVEVFQDAGGDLDIISSFFGSANLKVQGLSSPD